jgi:hypothetical protein
MVGGVKYPESGKKVNLMAKEPLHGPIPQRLMEFLKTTDL